METTALRLNWDCSNFLRPCLSLSLSLSLSVSNNQSLNLNMSSDHRSWRSLLAKLDRLLINSHHFLELTRMFLNKFLLVGPSRTIFYHSQNTTKIKRIKFSNSKKASAIFFSIMSQSGKTEWLDTFMRRHVLLPMTQRLFHHLSKHWCLKVRGQLCCNQCKHLFLPMFSHRWLGYW